MKNHIEHQHVAHPRAFHKKRPLSLFLWRRLEEALGLILMSCGFIALISLIAMISPNAMIAPNAIISWSRNIPLDNILWQFAVNDGFGAWFGASQWVIIAIMVIWGYAFLRHHHGVWQLWRVLLSLFSLVLLSLFLAAAPSIDGGKIGSALLDWAGFLSYGFITKNFMVETSLFGMISALALLLFALPLQNLLPVKKANRKIFRQKTPPVIEGSLISSLMARLKDKEPNSFIPPRIPPRMPSRLSEQDYPFEDAPKKRRMFFLSSGLYRVMKALFSPLTYGLKKTYQLITKPSVKKINMSAFQASAFQTPPHQAPPYQTPPHQTYDPPYQTPTYDKDALDRDKDRLSDLPPNHQPTNAFPPQSAALPPLTDTPPSAPPPHFGDVHHKARQLSQVLEDFGIQGEITDIKSGRVITLFQFCPAAGVKSSRIIALADDIARSMSAVSARIAIIPGQNALGIELPNAQRGDVHFADLLSGSEYQNSDAALPLILGETISGTPIVVDLAQMPHLLVAGTTGSGKSVALNAMILSLLYRLTPQQCRMIMIDPKMLELSVYQDIPHLLAPVVTDPKKAVLALKWAVKEMEQRYQKMSALNARNINNYNHKQKDDFMPFIVIVIDEMADLMMVAGKEIEACVQRLAQMARAAGIHLIAATQRPSVDVITGTIKANFPTRISFQVSSRIDSRTILGEGGAEQLLGRGDMLFMRAGGRFERIHGPFVSDSHVEEVANFLRQTREQNHHQDDVIALADFDSSYQAGEAHLQQDGLYPQAVDIVRQNHRASTSFLQRKLQIGYNRAARLIEQMEEEGIVSAPNHVGKRQILNQ